ncbi:uncharacterized protein LOC131877304 [Tigriopus californicus]|uniref:uncharacterized protein LOC131877304 n=1 Tax=Tigriopus californicus TaxID=6832 RepID=UPI0027DA547D|nr:uncharacterized protein LOC131877304 [Tigriopus californicus]
MLTSIAYWYLPVVLLTTTSALTVQTTPKKLKNGCNSIRENWPASRKLIPRENQDAFGDAPFFRLTTSSDISVVEPDSNHILHLVPTGPSKNISHFMIWTETHDDNCDSALSGLSEICSRPMEKCNNILVNQSSEDGRLMGDISFEWQAGSCGYHDIKVQVIDADQSIYSPENDPFETLKISCYVDVDGGTSLI